MFNQMVALSPKLTSGIIWCHVCGNQKSVDSTRCLKQGWPLCCGQTMSLDPPEELWKSNGPDARNVQPSTSR